MKSKILFIGATLAGFIVLTGLLITFEAFENLYAISREHEDWELDELIIGIFSAAVISLISLSVLITRNLRALQAETRLRERFQNEANATRHLQALGTLAGGLAHSANNQLQPIIVLARLSQDEVPKTSEVYEYQTRILNSANEAAKLFRDVLSFSRSDGQETESLDIRDQLQATEKLLTLSIGQSASLELELEFSGLIPMGSTSFTDAMLALVSNAADAIAGNDGHISISTFQTPERALGLRVEDNGAGMTPDQLERAFDPFFTSKDVDKGTGLGLSIVRSLVERAGGNIHITSTLGTGTVVEIVFPSTQAV